MSTRFVAKDNNSQVSSYEHLGPYGMYENSCGYGHCFLFALTSITFGVTTLAERVVTGPL
jgi:hypothetical protein